MAISVAGTATNGFCPLVLTRTWTLTDPCGNSNAWNQTVTVTSTNPPVVDCACLQNEAMPVLKTNACFGLVPDLSWLNGSACLSNNCGPLSLTQSPPAGTVFGVGLHPITLILVDCSGHSAFCTLVFTVAQPPSIFHWFAFPTRPSSAARRGRSILPPPLRPVATTR